MDDKTLEHAQDSYEDGLSNCCGARVVLVDICSDCKEHCDLCEGDYEE